MPHAKDIFPYAILATRAIGSPVLMFTIVVQICMWAGKLNDNIQV
jgi:hypothetical protein